MQVPGVPFEMKYIMNEHVIPELKKRFSSRIIIHKNIMTYGTYEAKMAELLEGFEAELPANIKLAIFTFIWNNKTSSYGIRQ